MKIICNKNEFAEIVRRCYNAEDCNYCALSGACDGQDSVVAFTDVIDEGEKDGKAD